MKSTSFAYLKKIFKNSTYLVLTRFYIFCAKKRFYFLWRRRMTFAIEILSIINENATGERLLELVKKCTDYTKKSIVVYYKLVSYRYSQILVRSLSFESIEIVNFHSYLMNAVNVFYKVFLFSIEKGCI